MLNNHQLEVGELFQGRYKILKFLKEWQLGKEFLAFDHRTDLKVIFKKLDWSHRNQKTVKALRDFFSSIHKFSHKNILKIHEMNLQDEVSYIITEAHLGETLRNKIFERDKDDFSATEISSCLKQVLNALEYAHSNGVLHRNLKPEVIALGQDGNWKIADFCCSSAHTINIAKKLDRFMRLKGRDELYKAPELFDPYKPESIKSDIYSMGLVAFELLGGSFPSFSPSQLIAMKWDWKRPFRELPVISSEKLKEALLEATLNNSEQRLGSISEFSAALQN